MILPISNQNTQRDAIHKLDEHWTMRILNMQCYNIGVMQGLQCLYEGS